MSGAGSMNSKLDRFNAQKKRIDRFIRHAWISHFFFMSPIIRILGVRNRLRCPRCQSVGTWKPHGGWLWQSDKISGKRWLCKYCGLYYGYNYGIRQAFCDPNLGCWRIEDFYEDKSDIPVDIIPPAKMVEIGYNISGGESGYTINPWRG